MPNRPLLEAEIKLLFALLDAADEAGAIAGQHRNTWMESKRRFNAWTASDAGPALCQLLDELDAAGALGGTWVQSRWLTVRAQLESRGHAPAHHRASSRRPAKAECCH